MLRDEEGQLLCTYARQCIAEALGGPPAQPPTSDTLQCEGATFVTLYRSDVLHGCIGSLEAHQPLLQDVADNAVSAALRDPRATPLLLGLGLRELSVAPSRLPKIKQSIRALAMAGAVSFAQEILRQTDEAAILALLEQGPAMPAQAASREALKKRA